MKTFKVTLNVPSRGKDFGCAVPSGAIIKEHSKPGWVVNCSITDNSEISYHLTERLRKEFNDQFQRIWGEDYAKEEELLLWLTSDGITHPVTYSTASLPNNGEEFPNLGSGLPQGIDITLSNQEATAIRWRLVKEKLLGEKMSCHPIFRGRFNNLSKNYNSCFVLMPFKEEWSNRIYTRHITNAVKKVDFDCFRADELFGPIPIIEDIWEKICTSAVIIADLTGRNPNVFYELGIAHTVGTPVILISQDHEIPAFDTAHIRQIKYKDNSEACEQLEKDLEKALAYVQEKMRYPNYPSD